MGQGSQQVSITKGGCGGAGGTATPGGYNQGVSFAAEGNYSSTGTNEGVTITQPDLRVSNAAGSGPKAAAKGTGYNQGDQFAAKAGRSPVVGETGFGKLVVGSGDVRGGNSNPGTGYNKGASVIAAKK